MPRKSPVAILASLDFAEKPFRTGGSLEKNAETNARTKFGGGGTGRRHCGRNILGA